MTAQSVVYRFGEFELIAAERRLLRHGQSIDIPPKLLDTLLVLVRAHGSAVSKRDLTDAVWPDTFVVDNSLTKNISALRRLLGDESIETVTKFGYRLTLPLREDAPIPTKPPAARRSVASTIVAAAGVIALAAGISRHSSTSAEPSRYVAVHRLHVLNAPADQRYIAEAIPVAIRARLGTLLGVIVRTDETASADAIVRGTMESDGQSTQVFIEIVDVRHAVVEWAHIFSAGVAEVPALEQSICDEVSQHLSRHLTASQRAALMPADSRDAAATAEYLRGRDLLDRRVNIEEASAHLEAAVARDDRFALAWAALSEALAVPYRKHARDDIERATGAARRSLNIDPTLAEGHAALAYIDLFHRWNWTEAERELRVALRRNPTRARFYDWLAIALLPQGRTAEALAAVEHAHALDPESTDIAEDVILTRHLCRDFAGVERAARTMIANTPSVGTGGTRAYLINALVAEGRYDDALRELTKMPACEERPLLRAAIRYKAGERGERDPVLAALRDPRQLARAVAPDEVARIYVLLGEKREAIRWLERAYDQHYFGLIFAGADPDWDVLRGDPEFERLLSRIGVVTDPAIRRSS